MRFLIASAPPLTSHNRDLTAANKSSPSAKNQSQNEKLVRLFHAHVRVVKRGGHARCAAESKGGEERNSKGDGEVDEKRHSKGDDQGLWG